VFIVHNPSNLTKLKSLADSDNEIMKPERAIKLCLPVEMSSIKAGEAGVCDEFLITVLHIAVF
jgi:hypothetical protein